MKLLKKYLVCLIMAGFLIWIILFEIPSVSLRIILLALIVAGVGNTLIQTRKMEKVLKESENRYRQIWESSPNAIFTFNQDGTIASWNFACERLFGYSHGEVKGKNIFDFLIDEKDIPQVKTTVEGVFKGKSFTNMEWGYRCSNGSNRKTLVRAYPIRNTRGEIIEGVIANTDITERKKIEDELKETNEILGYILARTPLAIVGWDKEGRVTRWNKEAEKIFGWRGEEVIGRKLFDFLIPDSAKARVKKVVDDLLQGKLPSHSINENLTKSGKIIICEWHNTIVRNSSGDFVEAVSIGQNITKKKRKEKALQEMAIKDHLTGLYNQRYFYQILKEQEKRAKRYKEVYSLLYLDIDNFKECNDIYGHLEGDKVLKTLGRIIKNNIRNSDYACRYGGEEFVILLLNTPKEKAKEVAERIRREIYQKLYPKYKITVSIGIADSTNEKDNLVKLSDEAMYKAKRKGKNRIEVS